MQKLSCNLKMFWMHCFHVSRNFKKSHWKRSFFVIFFACSCEFICRCFNMFVNFGRVFFAVTLTGCFLRMLNKQARHFFKKGSKWDVFHPRTKYLYGKYCLGYSEIPSTRDGMKNVPASYKRNNFVFWKNNCIVLWSRLLPCLVLLVIPSRLSYKRPLTVSSQILKVYG